jgi:DDE superfamily endonuclease
MPTRRFASLLRASHRALKAPVVLVWDNLNTHRSRKMRQFTEANSDWLTVGHLPGYAPTSTPSRAPGPA